MNKRKFFMTGMTRGFSLLEMLISLALLSLLLLFFVRTITFALEVNRNIRFKFELIQIFENRRNLLVSKAFDSQELEEGNHVVQDKVFKTKWQIWKISANLKAIELTIKCRHLKQQGQFYKSKFIGEVQNESGI